MTPQERLRAQLPPKPFGASVQEWADLCAEIEDHLCEAYDASLGSEPEDDAAAFDAAVADLGMLPTSVVRSLWWESLGGAWLRAWVQTISIVIFVTVITIMSVRLFVEFRAFASQGREMLSAIPKDLATQFYVWRVLDLEVIRASDDGRPRSGVTVSVTGRPFKNDFESLIEKTDAKGRCTFGPMRVGQFEIGVQDPDLNLTWIQNMTVYPVENAGVLTLVLPAAAPTALRFDVPDALFAVVPALLIEGEVVPEPDSPWVAPLDIVVSKAGIRLALREDNIEIRREPVRWPYKPYPARLYSDASTPGDHLDLAAGSGIRIASIRVLDAQGVASARRLPLGPSRQFSLAPDTINVIPLDLDAATAAAIAEAQGPDELWENS